MSLKLCKICKGLFLDFAIKIVDMSVCNECNDLTQKMIADDRKKVIDDFIKENRR